MTVWVVQAAVDGIRGAVDDGYEGGGGESFAGEGAVWRFLVGGEVGVFVAEVVEAAEGGVAAEVDFEDFGCLDVDGRERGEDVFGGGDEQGEVVIEIGRGRVGEGLDETEGDEEIEDVFDLLFLMGAGVVE